MSIIPNRFYWFSFYRKNKDDTILNHYTFAIDPYDFDPFITGTLHQTIDEPISKITYTIKDNYHYIQLNQQTVLDGNSVPVSRIWTSYFKKFTTKYPKICDQ
jgi:hypothetical protein